MDHDRKQPLTRLSRVPRGWFTLTHTHLTWNDKTAQFLCSTMFQLATHWGHSPPAISSVQLKRADERLLPCLLLRFSMKVVKAAAQVLNTLWQYRDLRTIYKKVRREAFRRSVKGIHASVFATASFPVCPNRTDGTRTISSHRCRHLKGIGSSPSPRCPPVPSRCPRSTTPVGSHPPH